MMDISYWETVVACKAAAEDDCHAVVAEGAVTCSDWEHGPKVEINMSSIFSRLIEQAGRWCENYASDILIWVEKVQGILSMPHGVLEEPQYILGFYASGVDLFDARDPDRLKKLADSSDGYYRALWLLTIKDGDSNTVKCYLDRIDRM